MGLSGRTARSLLAACALAAILSPVACRPNGQTSPELDWLRGDWHGVRRDGDDGTEAPIEVHVTTMGDGETLVERLEVPTGETRYVGFAVHTPTGVPGAWSMLYANSTRDSFSRLVGTVEKDRVVWRSVTPGRARDSQVTVERLGDDRWRRTNRVSEDGGRTWRVLFTDELERSPAP